MPLNSTTEMVEPVLLSGLVDAVTREKARQFPASQVHFQIMITDKAQFAFAQLPLTQITRAVALLIDNAVTALRPKGRVKIKLDASVDTVTVAVQDNGKGMNFDKLNKMLSQEVDPQSGCAGTKFGMAQVWSLLEQCKGVLNVDTLLGDGTSIEMMFPRVAVPGWIATKIELTTVSLIVILDPDLGVYEQWRQRFDIYLRLYPDLRIYHFTQAQAALNFLLRLPRVEKTQVVLLSEYSFPGQPLNGLEVRKFSEVSNVTLVTRHFCGASSQREPDSPVVKIIPKHMIPLIPLVVDS